MKQYWFIALLFLYNAIPAQEPDWEKILAGENESADDAILQEFLERLQQKPLDINRATARELQLLPWLDPLLSRRIVAFRKEKGAFQSLRQLLLVHGMTESLLLLLSPYLECKDLRPVTNWAGAVRWRVQQPLQSSRGFKENHYLGPNTKIQGRLSSNIGSFLQMGALTERDAGEPTRSDYTCGYLHFSLKNPDLDVILGDLSVESGQGFVFSHPGQWGGDWDALLSAKKRQTPLRSYLSTDENAGLRGIAVSGRSEHVQITGLYSSTRIDASLQDQSIRSFPGSGLHRCSGELADKDRAVKTVSGAIVQWLVDSETSVGFCLQKSSFAHPVRKQERPDNLFTFSGQENHMIGLNWDILYHEINWFGEVAYGGRSAAGKTGLWWEWSFWQNVLQLSVIPPAFHNMLYPHLDLIDTNQGAWLWLQKWRLSDAASGSLTMERSVHRWLRYHLPLAFSVAEQFRLVLELAVSRKLSITLRGKASSSPAAKTAADGQKTISQQRRHSLQSQIDWQLAKKISLRTRFEWNQVQRGSWLSTFRADSQGVAFYQQAQFKMKKIFSLSLRALVFHSPGSENSFYEFEQDLPGMMRIKMVYGKGYRWYTLVNMHYGKFTLSVKYEETRYDDRDHISSGWDEIAGNRERMAAVQCDWRW